MHHREARLRDTKDGRHRRLPGLVALLLLTACQGLPGERGGQSRPQPGGDGAPAAEPSMGHTAGGSPRPEESSGAGARSDDGTPAAPSAPRPVAGAEAVDPNRSAAAPPAAADLWQRLRGRFVFGDRCDGQSQVRRWALVHARDPAALRAELARVVPTLDLVAGVLALRGIPSDFALLPWVESRYRAVPATGNRPAGIWQLMPATARDFGLVVSPQLDERLDLYASTHAAAALLEHLGQRFGGDWRLVAMAFNAGEFRVARALARQRDAGGAYRPEDLPLSPITHAHLAQLEAIGCILRDPDFYAVELPAADPAHRLRAVALPFALDRDLAEAIADVDADTFDALNPAVRGPLIAAGRHLLLPQRSLARWQTLIAALPAKAAARDWRFVDPPRHGGRAVAALEATGLPPAWLSALHDGEHVRGRAGPARLLPVARHREAALPGMRRYRVREGDSAWAIARRLGVRLEALLQANGLGERSTLRPGQWLRIPD